MVTLRLVKGEPKYRIEKDTVRPYRLWDSGAKHDMQYRYYATERRALDSALLLVRWGKVGFTIEVYDIRTARWLGTYARKVNAITFER